MKKRKNNETKRLYITLAIVLGILAIFILYSAVPYMFGKEIILQTKPIDPFHPLLGQYMNVGYEISEIENSDLDVTQGDMVYISLKKDSEGISRFESISKNKPASGDFIRGTVEYLRGNSIGVQYGIESYYFQRRAVVPTENITMKVVIASSGRAKISEILQNGKPAEIKYED